ncbi:MAG: bifunctional UDP-N-acetylmuramoyl-tripeptide:D-alanyl-D-alanine ligase/alanine racemase [Bacteroidales bacterium]|nr:bifunctional UDP-N-acetylmuramoyl-tripeptide:D-alanyl-D-alanine ligase/alanine racemase [Bacteroidales bacterium]
MLLSEISALLSDIPLPRDLNFPQREIDILLTDSRSLIDPDHSLFFALRTNRADGHSYVGELYDRGVRAFVVDTDLRFEERFPEADFITVTSVSSALMTVAAANRRANTMPVISITGSRGKTLVKEWLYLLLRDDYRVARSPRSYNSSIGVPLSLWQLNPEANLAIIEAGISAEGEMHALERMISPDIVVLTSISSDHSDGFVSINSKIEEKLSLAAHASTLVYPGDDAAVVQAIAAMQRRGALPASLYKVDSSGFLPEISAERFAQFNHAWERRNAATCLAVMVAMGIDTDVALERISRLRPMGTRLRVVDGVNHNLLISDDYLCDLHSLAPALDFMARRATADHTTTLVVSDLDHEAATATETYAELGRLCDLRKITSIIGIGAEISSHKVRECKRDRYFNDMDAALAALSTTDFDHQLILFKGAPDNPLDRLSRMLEARTHETVLEVNLDALVSNYNFYRSRLRRSTGIVAMVKASGYGAGSYELAKTLQSAGAAYLAVAVLDEGIDLRRAGITMPIMVLNPKVLNYRQLFSNRLEPEIFSFDILEEIIEQARRLGVRDYPVHLKLDTGMHRLGFLEEDLPRVISLIHSQDCIRVSSVFSHLATADCPDMNDYTEGQLSLFDRLSSMIVDAFPEWNVKRHILNTAGIIRYPEYQYDMVRLGIGLYGVPTLRDGSEAQLRQVSTLSTVIIAVKEWEAGTTIGYGRRGILTRRSRIATIPIGYADGINRRMGCGAVSFLVNGHPCPTVGNICMDICMIDITDAPAADGTPGGEAAVGDTVVVFSPDNPVTPMADTLGTIPYEILTSISPRVRRIYYTE